MSIKFSCQCGNVVHAPDGSSGKKGKCKKCGSVLTIPFPDAPEPIDEDTYDFAEPEPVRHAPPAPTHALQSNPVPDYVPPAVAAAANYPSTGAYRPRSHGIRRYLYLVLLLVLIPLAMSTLQKHEGDEELKERFVQTIKHHPELRSQLENLSEDATEEDIIQILPDHKIEGALFPRDTWNHWILAAISAAVFLAAAILIFPAGSAKWWQLVLVGIGTGTAGIFLLLAFQWLAFHMPFFRGRGILALILDFIWLIGQSYRLALGDTGFLLSFLGFTAGVGFCEETCKALPLIFRARSHGYSSWRDAMIWGLVSGVGFGVSEGITYSSDYYNGISGADMYYVRFISCVGLHAIWAAAIGIMIFRKQDHFRSIDNLAEALGRILQVIIVPMILHGLYDTLLKQQYELWALVVALASFVWLAYQIERSERQFGDVVVERA